MLSPFLHRYFVSPIFLSIYDEIYRKNIFLGYDIYTVSRSRLFILFATVDCPWVLFQTLDDIRS